MKEYTWKEAIYKVMIENGGEMTANEITDAILTSNLRKHLRQLLKQQLAQIFMFLNGFF